MKIKSLIFLSGLYSLLLAQTLFSDLVELEQRIQKELEILNFPSRKNWLPERKTSQGEHIYDVVIVGGGQTGLAIAFSLQREKITNVIIFDERPEGLEGQWLTHARMETLRTPKYTIGPDGDVPGLTIRAWYEAKYGEESWQNIRYIPRLKWAEYLRWFRNFLRLPVVNETKVGAIKWLEEENCFAVPVTFKEGQSQVYARKIVLATGLEGSGEWTVPEHIKKNIPKEIYYHTSDEIDFQSFEGKKIGILGAGPCAFDHALLSCEYGAQEVHLFSKRPKLVNLHVFLWGEFVGFLKHFPDLPDEDKWRFIAKMYEIGQPPTPQSVASVRAKKNIKMHFNSPWLDSKLVNGKPVVVTHQGEEALDILIIATGWITDLRLRPELDDVRHHIALWADRFTPPSHQNYEALLLAPYLKQGFTLVEKIPGTAPYLSSIFNCTGGALVSMGFSAGTGITGMKYSLKTITYEIVRQLFVEDKDYFYQTLETYDNYLFEN